MVAVFDVAIDFGGAVDAPGTIDQVATNLRFKDADNNTQDLNNPIVIPGAGNVLSRWKHCFLKCTTAPDTQVDGVVFYTTTAPYPTGVTLLSGDETPIKTDALTTGYDVSDVSDEAMTNHADITASTDVAGNYTSSGTAKSISINEAGSVIDAIGETTNYLVLQLQVASTATQGTMPTETLRFEYNEV
jgi:hypothetical protein